jgi:uncharacterized protein (UPF0335 family)
MPDGELQCTIQAGDGRLIFTGDLSELQRGELLGSSDKDFARAAALVVSFGNGSVAWLQRHLQVGYNTAAKHMERMQTLGLVGPPNYAGKREVLDNAATRAVKAAIALGAAGGEAAVEAAEIYAEPVIKAAVEAGAAQADTAARADALTAETQGRLKSFIERIERLEEDKAVVANDLKEVFAEAKGEGFDTKIMRKIVRLRKQDVAARDEEEALLGLYMSAIGMV